MDSDEALGIALKVGTGAASYEEALQFLVERAVRLSTGQGRILPKKPEKTPVRIVSITKPEYIVAAPHALESVTLNPTKRGTKGLLAMHRAAGKVIIPYRYSAYYDGEQLTLAEGDDLPDRLCECLHEKRHSSWREGGLHGTRLNLNFYGKNRNMGDRVSDAGLMEEAACDAMAHYDMLVFSHITKEPELRKLLRNEVKQHRRVTTEQRRLIEERKTALAEGEAGASRARLLLIRFGDWAAPGDEESRLCDRLERAVRTGKEERARLLKREIAELMKDRQPEAAEMVLSGECDLEDVLHCQMAHYSHYMNREIEPRIMRLMHFVAPKHREVASGKARNPFIDLIGIHAGFSELLETLAYARRASHMERKRIHSEMARERTKLLEKSTAAKYDGLRRLYILAAVARRKRISIRKQLSALRGERYPKPFARSVRRFVSLF